MKLILFFIVASCSFFLPACVTESEVPQTERYTLTKKELETHGAKVFEGSKAKVSTAAEEALKTMGYTISTRDPKRGLIVTEPMSITGVVENRASRQQFRKYVISVEGTAERAKVTAKPVLLSGTKDISSQKVWTLDGPEGEKVRWEKYFELVGHFL